MSNPLFASHMMQMAYLCKKQPPAALLGCWPLAGDTFNDLSIYGGSNNLSSLTTTKDSSFGFPFVFVNSENNTYNFTLGKSLDLTRDWSIDFSFYFNASYISGDILSLGALKINAWNYDWWNGFKIYFSGTQIYDTGNVFKKQVFHFALTYLSSSEVIRFYINGAKYAEVSQSLVNTASVSQIASNFRCWYQSEPAHGFSNLRVAQKVIGSSAGYPTPTGLYTGYETL